MELELIRIRGMHQCLLVLVAAYHVHRFTPVKLFQVLTPGDTTNAIFMLSES